MSGGGPAVRLDRETVLHVQETNRKLDAGDQRKLERQSDELERARAASARQNLPDFHVPEPDDPHVMLKRINAHDSRFEVVADVIAEFRERVKVLEAQFAELTTGRKR